jgi:hypothetical protein
MSRAVVRVSSLLLVVMAVASLAGCATTPAPALPPAVALQPADLKSLAGEWEGSVTGSRSGTFDGPRLSGTMSVKEDGSFTSNLGGQPGGGSSESWTASSITRAPTCGERRPFTEPARPRS